MKTPDPVQPSERQGGPVRKGHSSTLKLVWWAYFPATLVAILGIMITHGAYVFALQREQSRVEVAFQEAAQDRVLFVQREVAQAIATVEDLASFFEATAVVGRREFRKFVGPTLKRHTGIRSLQWVSAVRAEDRDDYITWARHSFSPFQIREVNPEGSLIVSPDRPILYPVLYVQPYGTHKSILGMNMGIDPVVADLLREAEVGTGPRVSPAIAFDDATDDSKSVIVVVPVYFDYEETNEAEDSPTDATAEIKGFALGVFSITEIVERALANLRAGGIDIDIYQVQEPGSGSLIYTHFSRLRKEPTVDAVAPDGLRFSRVISVANQRWELACTPAPGRFVVKSQNSWMILAGGLAFTALLTTYLVTLLGQARRVRQEVDLRTAQLSETVQKLNREVAERKSAERELQILNETQEQHIATRTAEAERKAEYLEQFAYVTSHDLKAPLRAVSNLAGWIEEDLADKLDDASREQLNLLRDRVQRMHNLIEGLLEYSRVGKTSGPVSAVDTHVLITELIDSLSPPKEFKFKVQQAMPTLHVDRLQLGQVFSNLISNSLKHHGGHKGKIRIGAEEHPNHHEFYVCDNGQGIAPEYHKKIFMMFQTLSFGDFENSTGIGLALVKKIVEENGGTIRVESAPGKGACFFFTWPKIRAAD